VTYQKLYTMDTTEKRKKTLKKSYLSNHTVRCCISVVSCDILDHVANEIRSNTARVTLQLDESTRDAASTVRQGGSKKVEGNGDL